MDDRLRQILRERFGLDDFRGEQRPVIDRLLAGGDAVVVWPTGSGKSLVYQLPALALPEDRPVVVLSPLIALMQDQVAALRAKGIAASFINSSLDRPERERRAADFARGRHRLLYVTPERFRNADFLAAIAPVKVGLLAVDEAHCISTWGHDFRPEYGRVGKIRERLGRPPTVALTATATPAVIAEIQEKLALPTGSTLVSHAGIERPNLFLAVTIAHDEQEKWERVAALLDRIPGAGIVYGALIRDLHRLEEFLRVRAARAGGARAPLLVYHGDLSREERRAMHTRFQSEPGGVRVLATRAFGMGIDKPDLRFIVHHQAPGSVEELWQEVGRAGRDGLPSWCELVYCEQDLPIQMQFVRAANPDRRLFREVQQRIAEWTARGEAFDLEKLRLATSGRVADGRVETCLSWLETLAPDEDADAIVELGPEKERRDLARLGKVVEYVRTTACRRRFLHDYFGIAPPLAANCGACDVCVNREEWLARHFEVPAPPAPETASATATAAAPIDRPPQRGDYVRVDGRILGRVVRVSGKGRDARVEVELSSSLETRSFPVRRHRIERLDA